MQEQERRRARQQKVTSSNAVEYGTGGRSRASASQAEDASKGSNIQSQDDAAASGHAAAGQTGVNAAAGAGGKHSVAAISLHVTAG